MDAVIAGQRVVDTWPATGIPVELASDVVSVQRLAASAATHQGFSTAGSRAVERLAVDLATHLVSHEAAGRILVRFIDWEERHGVEILLSTTSAALVEAADLREAALASDLFEVYAVPGKGTVMVAQLWGGPQTGAADRRFLVGSMSDPIEGEPVSGDEWAVEQHDARIVALVADGLGHGDHAAVASQAAVSTFRAHHREPVEHIAARLHEALRPTRGAAIALVEVDREVGELRFCGIGNVVARLLLADGAHELVSRYGIAGYQAPQIQTVIRPWPDDAMLVVHSDGLSPRWSVDAYPHLRLQHPQLAASTVMRDATRANDDAVVIALRGIVETARFPRGETA